MLATLLLLAGQAHATDVLVPTITPRSLSDFAPAERLTEEVLNQMADKGIAFVPPSEIQKRAGEVHHHPLAPLPPGAPRGGRLG